ncbi:MAG: hypothetical protein NWP98_07360, partial [Erythrobacter sp.]|nr:hypothetical protein [Erythrobacter sp.]
MTSLVLVAGLTALTPARVCAAEADANAEADDSPVAEAGAEAAPVIVTAQAAPGSAPGPAPFAFNPVFDETWATIGLGAGLVPSYAG